MTWFNSVQNTVIQCYNYLKIWMSFKLYIKMIYFKICSQARKIAKSRSAYIIMTGQEKSGKTSILYRLKLNDFIVTKPTTHPIQETLEIKTSAGNRHTIILVDLGHIVKFPVSLHNHDRSTLTVSTDCESNYDDSTASFICTCNQNLPNYNTKHCNHLNKNDNNNEKNNSNITIKNYNQSLEDVNHTSRLYKHYQAASGFIYVIDGQSTYQQLNTCKEDIEELLYQKSRESDGGRLIILVNKQDQVPTISIEQVNDALGLPSRLYNTRWRTFPCSALSGEGLTTALTWLLFGHTNSVHQKCYNTENSLEMVSTLAVP